MTLQIPHVRTVSVYTHRYSPFHVSTAGRWAQWIAPTRTSSEHRASIVDFFENVYIPGVAGTLECSTVKGYKDSWRCHIRDRVSGRVRDFRTCDGENLMCAIEAANKTKTDDLAHGTYTHIKVTLSAMFTFAKRKGIYEGVNPMTGVTIPKGKKHGRERLAYSLEEVGKHLELFSRTHCHLY
jgi:hypothetical protein